MTMGFIIQLGLFRCYNTMHFMYKDGIVLNHLVLRLLLCLIGCVMVQPLAGPLLLNCWNIGIVFMSE